LSGRKSSAGCVVGI